MHEPAAVDALSRDPRRTGIFSDFDGTLAAIIDDPAAARPVTGAVAAINDLAKIFATVGVVSGRPLSFIEPFFDPGVLLAGLYGLETRVAGVHRGHQEGDAWRQVVAGVVGAAADDAPIGMRVESKGLSLTLHFRGMPEIAGAVQAWAEAQAARTGLEVRAAKMSVELHPPLAVDKGTTLLGFCEGLGAVCFIGDDVGDLPAFDALDSLAAGGVTAVRVVARSPEVSAEMLDRADVVVDGPIGVVGLLEALRSAAASADRRDP